MKGQDGTTSVNLDKYLPNKELLLLEHRCAYVGEIQFTKPWFKNAGLWNLAKTLLMAELLSIVTKHCYLLLHICYLLLSIVNSKLELGFDKDYGMQWRASQLGKQVLDFCSWGLQWCYWDKLCDLFVVSIVLQWDRWNCSLNVFPRMHAWNLIYSAMSSEVGPNWRYWGHQGSFFMNRLMPLWKGLWERVHSCTPDPSTFCHVKIQCLSPVKDAACKHHLGREWFHQTLNPSVPCL